jgi:hypothetical protein
MSVVAAPARRSRGTSGESGAPRTIGAVELVTLAEFGIERLPARVDTGARTSALHVEGLTELGDGRVRFELVKGRNASVEAVVSRRGRVRSTSGKIESRPFVTVRARLGDIETRIEVGLVNRGAMQYRMLLGRSALAGQFVVDVARRFVLGR